MKQFRFFLALFVVSVPTGVIAMNIDPVDKYAWGENIGWINFGSVEGDVDVSTTAIDGYAWGENVGWISLNCSNTSSCGTTDFGVTVSGSTVAGYAWGENIGWISFNCSNTASCGTVDYSVTVDTGTGIFSGYAWGENVGWIVFNCATTSSCGDVDYKLRTTAVLVSPTPSATPTPTTGGGGGGGGGGGSPTPGISPTGAVSPGPSVSGVPPGTTSPLISPSVSVGPIPSLFPTPTASPGQATPPSGPPLIPVTVRNVSDRLIDALDRFGVYVFETMCQGPLGVAACGVAVLPLLTLLLAVIAWFTLGYHFVSHARDDKSLQGYRKGLIGPGWKLVLIVTFFIGVFIVPINYLRNPTTYNLIICILFVIANALCAWFLTRPSHNTHG